MQRLKLPDGSYVNPGTVDRVQVKKHFLGKNYYVQMHLDHGGAINVCVGLPEVDARKLRLQYEQQLETLPLIFQHIRRGERPGFLAERKWGMRMVTETVIVKAL
jgi:hypothetical protein